METTNIDNHIFGEPSYLSAELYQDGETITVKVVEFIGRVPYVARDGTNKRAGVYQVVDKIGTKEFRLGIKNEILLKHKYGLAKYEDLKGRNIQLQVKAYNLGKGFVLVGVSKA